MMAVVKRDGWNMDGLSEDPGVEEDEDDDDDDDDEGGGGDGVVVVVVFDEEEAAATVTATFMPAPQWPVMEQM